MRWGDFRRSGNIEDRRGGGGLGGGGGGFGMRAGGLGVGTVVVLSLLGWVFGIDPSVLIGGAEIITGGPAYESPASPPTRSAEAPGDEVGQFVAAVLGETEDRWSEIFQSAGMRYEPPKLVMFSGGTRSACGVAQSAMGPFYCPNDRRVYLDTAFFRQIETRLRGCDAGSKACQFSQAYVIAHEVGHHVQNILGVLARVQERQGSVSQAEANRIQVRVELQADCFAGVWAHHSQQKWKFLEPGDIDAALQTASAIGDDTLQKRSQGYVVPDAFTHGSAEQRKRWFLAGLKGGSVDSCNTFAAAQP